MTRGSGPYINGKYHNAFENPIFFSHHCQTSIGNCGEETATMWPGDNVIMLYLSHFSGKAISLNY